MNLIIFGAGSRLGKAWINSTAVSQYLVINRTDYFDLDKKKISVMIVRFLESISNNEKTYVLNCVAIQNSLQDFKEVYYWNMEFAVKLFEIAKELNLNYVTFGTMSEVFLAENTPNNYLSSKKSLTQHISRIKSEKWTHFRLHTLYGVGVPLPHSFLGQLLIALKTNSNFRMSNGNQIREYHHYEDEVNALVLLLNKGLFGIIDISSGASLRLKVIAKTTLSSLHGSLEVISAPTEYDKYENYFRIYSKNTFINEINFRDALVGIQHYLKELGV